MGKAMNAGTLMQDLAANGHAPQRMEAHAESGEISMTGNQNKHSRREP